MTVDITSWVSRRVDLDENLDAEVGLLVLAALEGEDTLNDYLEHGGEEVVADLAAEPPSEPAGAFLKSIRVEGFRGIGAPVEVGLRAAPGLTIIAGRNGSGKSSIAEALEMALTGSTYRWKNKASQWSTQWRNLHQSKTARILVQLVEEGEGITKIGVDWATEEEQVTVFSSWVQRPGAKRVDGTDSLGWKAALDTYRPMMSYDELGGLLEAVPSALHDALAKALGMEQLTDAIALLESRAKPLRETESSLNTRRRQLQQEAAALGDERAVQVAALLKKTAPDIDRLRSLVTVGGSPDSAELSGIQGLASLNAPDIEAVDLATTELREAAQSMISAAESDLALRAQQIDLRTRALELHETFGDMPCPVCAGAELDQRWAESSRDLIAAEDHELAQLRHARHRLDSARQRARTFLFSRPRELDAVPAPGLETVVEKARTAWDAWTAHQPVIWRWPRISTIRCCSLMLQLVHYGMRPLPTCKRATMYGRPSRDRLHRFVRAGTSGRSGNRSATRWLRRRNG